MKKILVLNPKGGCGKTTIATNIASYYALWDVATALIDYDPQQSSLEWCENRPDQYSAITAIDGSKGRLSVPREIHRVIMDSPARTSTTQLRKLFGLADKVIIPVLPSPIDMRACENFLSELMGEKLLLESEVALVANRVRENTLIFQHLQTYLSRLEIPLVSFLRDSQSYIRANLNGIGVFEMPPYQVDKEIEQWRPIIEWLESTSK